MLTKREVYAWCLVLSISGVAWLIAGWTGPVMFWVGLYVGPMDIGWVDDLFDRNETGKQPEGTETKLPEPLPDNVTPLPVRRIRRTRTG